MMNKNFRKDLEIFASKLQSKENFAFTRFSDGEADILKNLKLVITDNYVIEGNYKHNFGYSEEDHKHFDPEQHGHVREKLIKAFQYDKSNYYTGISCPCCIGGAEEHVWAKKNTGRASDYLTWANLFVNGNYPYFIKNVLPILSDRKIVMVCSENADLKKAKKDLNFDIVKDFRVGKNCIVNDHHLIDDIKEWIDTHNIKDHVFLFSASSLSEILIHELFKDFDNNTYLDIGTTLHPFFDLKVERDYLKGYWLEKNLPDINKMCSWLLDVRMVNNQEKYWEAIRQLRNHPLVKTGFVEQEYIDEKQHGEYMKKYSQNFYILLCEGMFAGYIGVIDRDIRVATHPDFQGNGFGKAMVDMLMKMRPDAFAKVKIDNKASLKMFEACGFKKKYFILEKA